MIFFLDTVDILINLHQKSRTLFFFFELWQNLMIALHSKDHLTQGKRIDTSMNLSDICKVVVQ